MAGVICPALAETLENGRARFNAEFLMARQRFPRLDPTDFHAHLREVVSPIVETVSRVAPDSVRETVDVLYEFSLDLLGKGLFARYPAVLTGWKELFPALAPALAAQPRLFAGSVINALHKLASTPGARPEDWIIGLLTLGPACSDAAQLLEAGKVLAWRSGLAQFRPGALAVSRTLPPHLALAALGVPGADPSTFPGILDQLEADPWLAPQEVLQPPPTRQLRLVSRPGAFRGFGGLFVRPPQVLSVGADLYVTDGQDAFSLHADRFGAVFQRVPQLPTPDPGNSRYTLMNGVIHATDGQQAAFPLFGAFTSCAGTEQVLAVTIPQSHSVFLVAVA
jgi:hypothetical protein